jgi:hypothetical protein
MRLQLVLIALVLSGQALAASSPGSNKLSIAGISPGDTLRDITTTLGRPIAKERSEGFIVLRVRYDRLSFDLDEDGLVANASTTNPKHCFKGWLCPGASLAKVRSRLPGLTQPSSPSGPLVAYADGDGCWLEITARSQTITALAFKCQP